MVGLSVDASSTEERAMTNVTSVSTLARPLNLSRTHTGRTLAAAAALGGLGWSGARGRSPIWLSRSFRAQYAQVQAAKLAIIGAAFDAVEGVPDPNHAAGHYDGAGYGSRPLERTGMLKKLEEAAPSPGRPSETTIAARLDALPFCRLRLAIFAVATLWPISRAARSVAADCEHAACRTADTPWCECPLLSEAQESAPGAAWTRLVETMSLAPG